MDLLISSQPSLDISRTRSVSNVRPTNLICPSIWILDKFLFDNRTWTSLMQPDLKINQKREVHIIVFTGISLLVLNSYLSWIIKLLLSMILTEWCIKTYLNVNFSFDKITRIDLWSMYLSWNKNGQCFYNLEWRSKTADWFCIKMT